MPSLRLLGPLAALALLIAPLSPAFAQRDEMNISDQPGYIPDASEEQLPPQY